VKAFWLRQKNNIMMAFSYAKNTTTKNMVQKYGGSITMEPPMPASLPGGEVMSVLSNSDPMAEAAAISSGDFKVMVMTNGGDWREDSSYATISEANTQAKEIIKFYSNVLVVKQES
jgi:hypothetical protein